MSLFPVLLEVLIGLVVIYVVAALLVSGVQEFLATLLQWRGRHLALAIRRMMLNPELAVSQEDGRRAELLLRQLYANDLVQNANHSSRTWLARLWRRLQAVLHPGRRREPLLSYLEARTFSAALMHDVLRDVFVGEGSRPRSPRQLRDRLAASPQLPESFRRSLLQLVDRVADGEEGQAPLARFRSELEAMFNRSMDQAGAVYKRNAQAVCFSLGLVLAVLLDLNSLRLADTLHRSSALREPLANSAPAILERAGTVSRRDLEDRLAEPLPIQPLLALVEAEDGFRLDLAGSVSENGRLRWLKLLRAVPGWLISALAIYMGAPFWFEVLGRLVQVRATVRPEEQD